MKGIDPPTRQRELGAGHYFQEDLQPGDWVTTGRIVVTEAHIVAFAGLSGDFFDVHMDDAFAQELGFPGRIAHGILGLALIDGLKNRTPVRLEAIASLGWDWSFTAPILVGDRIGAEIRVAESRPTRAGDRGLVTLWIDATNQDGKTVQQGVNRLLVRRRESPDE